MLKDNKVKMYRCIFLVLISLHSVEVKVFIGDCSYGFCEQGCRRVETDTMECFCYKGFVMKNDGRKCEKVPDDNTYSGDDISGDNLNCDDETGKCDINTVSGETVEEEFSGDNNLGVKEIYTTLKMESTTTSRKNAVVAKSSKQISASTVTVLQTSMKHSITKEKDPDNILNNSSNRTSIVTSLYVLQTPSRWQSTDSISPTSIAYQLPYLPFELNSTKLIETSHIVVPTKSSVFSQTINRSSLATKSAENLQKSGQRAVSTKFSTFSQNIYRSVLSTESRQKIHRSTMSESFMEFSWKSQSTKSTKSSIYSRNIHHSVSDSSILMVTKGRSISLISLKASISERPSSSYISAAHFANDYSSIVSLTTDRLPRFSTSVKLNSSKTLTVLPSKLESSKLSSDMNKKQLGLSTLNLTSNMAILPQTSLASSTLDISKTTLRTENSPASSMMYISKTTVVPRISLASSRLETSKMTAIPKNSLTSSILKIFKMTAIPQISLTSSIIDSSVSTKQYSIGRMINQTTEQAPDMKISSSLELSRRASIRDDSTLISSIPMSSYLPIKLDLSTKDVNSVTTFVAIAGIFTSRSSSKAGKSLIKSSFNMEYSFFGKSTESTYKTQSLKEIPLSTSSYSALKAVDRTSIYSKEKYTTLHNSDAESSKLNTKKEVEASMFIDVTNYIKQSRFSSLINDSNSKRKSTYYVLAASKQSIFSTTPDSTVTAMTSSVVATAGNQTSTKGDGLSFKSSQLLVLTISVLVGAQLLQK